MQDWIKNAWEATIIDKVVADAAEALAGVRDGSVVMIGGFGSPGVPSALIDGLIEQGATNLTVVSNNPGKGREGLGKLLTLGRVSRLICTFPRSSDPVAFNELYAAGKIELEVVPQGTFAERMRAAGAGIPAFYTPSAVGTRLAEGKEVRTIDGRDYLLELALPGDVALIGAWRGDRWGNLTYRRSGRNFNPVMAMAATLSIAQVEEIGEIDPEAVVTPGIFVNRVLKAPYNMLTPG